MSKKSLERAAPSASKTKRPHEDVSSSWCPSAKRARLVEEEARPPWPEREAELGSKAGSPRSKPTLTWSYQLT